MDERFAIHRLRATRLAAIIGVLLIGLDMIYEFFAHNIFRVDLIAILIAIGVTKWISMFYYARID
jgi:hypothetical protein